MTFPYKLIDLTHTIDPSIPTWDGGCGFNPRVHIDYSDCKGDDKFCVMNVEMYAGIGTHMDAPSHCIQGGLFIHDFELVDLCMPCVVIDIAKQSHERYSLTPENIINFESQHGVIQQNTCVMVKTGWEQFWNDPQKYHNNHVFPSVSQEAAMLLLARGVKALGVDTLSPDRPEDGFKVHNLFLSAGRILIENVANLNAMPLSNGFVMILPLKGKNMTESPIRLVGLIT